MLIYRYNSVLNFTKECFLFFVFLLLLACDSGGKIADPPQAPIPTTTVSNEKVVVTWESVEGAVYYNVYWADKPGVEIHNMNLITSEEISVSIDGLSNDKPYYFVVTAVGEGNESKKSAEFKAIPIAPPEILNGNFETGEISPWIGDGTVSLLNVHEGLYALMLPGGGKGIYASTNQSFSVTAGNKYRFSTWLTVEGRTFGDYRMLAVWYNSNDTRLSASLIDKKITRNVVDVELIDEVMAPEGAVRVEVRLRGQQADGVGYFDDVRAINLNDSKAVEFKPTISSIVPNPATYGSEVFFEGSDEILNGEITNYRWTSDLENFELSNESAFNIATLSEGTHTISFNVQDDQGNWSEFPATQTLVIGSLVRDSTSMLSNGGFETGDLTSWIGNGTISSNNTHSGSFALVLHGNTTGYPSASQVISINEGKTYRFSTWITVEERTLGNYRMQARWLNANDKEISVSNIAVVNNNVTDIEFTKNEVAPLGATQVEVRLRAQKVDGIGYFDDARVIEIFE